MSSLDIGRICNSLLRGIMMMLTIAVGTNAAVGQKAIVQVEVADKSNPDSVTPDDSKLESAPSENDSENNSESETDEVDEFLAGHSYHGEAFNEGPRQKAYLMGGTGKVNFQVTTKSKDAQAFVNQGVGQLHGFWDLEAERSFRQAAALDPDCAMAYWGAALAAYQDRKRSKGLIAKAVDLKDSVSERERMYIEALAGYFESEKDDAEAKKKRANDYLKALESISMKYPDDLEAKAFICHRIWYAGREGVPISSYLAADALIREVLETEPLHPAHHYSIHLWDNRAPERALDAAARCGVSAPGIAHMWHMPGHIYSRLKRYEDAVYQQEASARVDHAHMMRDRVMPDEIGNFAHNNEWLIRNLIFIGRVHDAIDLAKNMISLPQHPKYNTLEKRSGSAAYGRRRLLSVLREYQQFDQAVLACTTNVLGGGLSAEETVKTDRLLACAAAMTFRTEVYEAAKSRLQKRLDDNRQESELLEARKARLTAALDESDDRPPRPVDSTIDPKDAKREMESIKKDLRTCKKLVTASEKALMAVEGYRMVSQSQFADAEQKLRKAAGEDVSWLGELLFRAGKIEDGLKEVRDQVKRRKAEVIPLARLAYLEYLAGDKVAAKASFNQLRDSSSSMDLDVDLFSRLAPVAQLCGYSDDWRKPFQLATDTGFRPQFDSLGPFRWSAPEAPKWDLYDANESVVSSSDFAGQPHLVIFYLGNGCLHCAEQLGAFAPQVSKFEEAGIKMIAISTDDQEELRSDLEKYTGEMNIRWMISNASLDVFKKFRAYDDFENQPLHGTFLIDGDGKIRWQDISYEPFMDHEFVLKEAKRLLQLNQPQVVERKAEDSGSDDSKKKVSLK